jgi:hypothetical protein
VDGLKIEVKKNREKQEKSRSGVSLTSLPAALLALFSRMNSMSGVIIGPLEAVENTQQGQ